MMLRLVVASCLLSVAFAAPSPGISEWFSTVREYVPEPLQELLNETYTELMDVATQLRQEVDQEELKKVCEELRKDLTELKEEFLAIMEQDKPLTDEERAEIDQEVESVKSELERLQEQVEQEEREEELMPEGIEKDIQSLLTRFRSSIQDKVDKTDLMWSKIDQVRVLTYRLKVVIGEAAGRLKEAARKVMEAANKIDWFGDDEEEDVKPIDEPRAS